MVEQYPIWLPNVSVPSVGYITASECLSRNGCSDLESAFVGLKLSQRSESANISTATVGVGLPFQLLEPRFEERETPVQVRAITDGGGSDDADLDSSQQQDERQHEREDWFSHRGPHHNGTTSSHSGQTHAGTSCLPLCPAKIGRCVYSTSVVVSSQSRSARSTPQLGHGSSFPLTTDHRPAACRRS